MNCHQKHKGYSFKQSRDVLSIRQRGASAVRFLSTVGGAYGGKSRSCRNCFHEVSKEILSISRQLPNLLFASALNTRRVRHLFLPRSCRALCHLGLPSSQSVAKCRRKCAAVIHAKKVYFYRSMTRGFLWRLTSLTYLTALR